MQHLSEVYRPLQAFDLWTQEWVSVDKIIQVLWITRVKAVHVWLPANPFLRSRYLKTNHTRLETFWFNRDQMWEESTICHIVTYRISFQTSWQSCYLLLTLLASWEKAWSDGSVSENITLINPWWMSLDIKHQWLPTSEKSGPGTTCSCDKDLNFVWPSPQCAKAQDGGTCWIAPRMRNQQS